MPNRALVPSHDGLNELEFQLPDVKDQNPGCGCAQIDPVFCLVHGDGCEFVISQSLLETAATEYLELCREQLDSIVRADREIHLLERGDPDDLVLVDGHINEVPTGQFASDDQPIDSPRKDVWTVEDQHPNAVVSREGGVWSQRAIKLGNLPVVVGLQQMPDLPDMVVEYGLSKSAYDVPPLEAEGGDEESFDQLCRLDQNGAVVLDGLELEELSHRERGEDILPGGDLSQKGVE